MSDTKIVTKSLLGGQDILLTPGVTQQNRAGTMVPMQGVHVPIAVSNITQLNLADSRIFSSAVLEQGEDITYYTYSATDDSGIASTYGGSWLRTSVLNNESSVYYKLRSFEAGNTLTNASEILLFEAEDAYYMWTGAYPKVVPVNSNPTSTGGIGVDKWLAVGGGSLKTLLATYKGASMIGYLKADVQRKLKESVSVQDYMTDEEIADANNTAGTMNHSHAFTEAFAESNVVRVPAVLGTYRVANVTIPPYAYMSGESSIIYNGYLDSHFYGKGSVIRKMPGATTMFNFGQRVTLSGILFDGYDKLAAMFARTTNPGMLSGIRAIYCGFYRFSAVGGSTGAQYTGLALLGCNINQNNNGIYNSIDSMYIGCTINANNLNGVHLLTGSNNNTFIGCRNEWNLGHNYYCYQATENNIIGELCDAAGKVGIYSNQGQWYVEAVRVKRSGRQAVLAADNCNFRIEGNNAVLFINGVKTLTGANDDGSGSSSPLVNIFVTGAASTGSKLNVFNSDMNGYVTSVTANTANIASLRFSNSDGLEDFNIAGFAKLVNGEHFIDRNVTTIVGVATGTVSMTAPALSTYSVTMRKFKLVTRNSSTGGFDYCTFEALIGRNAGAATGSISNVYSAPAGLYGTTGTPILLSLTNLAADASTFDITIGNTSGIYTRFCTVTYIS